MRKENLTPNCLFLLFLISFVLTKLIYPTSSSNLLISLTGVLCYLYMIFTDRIRSRKLILISCLYMLLMLISRWYNKNADLPEIIWNVSFTGVAALLYYKNINIKCMYFVFYIAAIYCIFLALKGYDIQEGLGDTGSINSISVLLIFLLGLIYIEHYRTYGNTLLPYMPVILTLIISIWTASRAGILSLFVFMTYILFHNLKNKKSAYLYTVIMILALVLFSLKFGDIFYANIIDKTNKFGTNSSRLLIWNEYFMSLNNFLNIFFGVEFDRTRDLYISFYNGNLHNSFLMLHSKYGLLGFLIVLLLIFKAFVKCLKWRNYVYLFVLITICIRASFDWCSFPGIFDVIFWFYAFFVLDKKKYLK